MQLPSGARLGMQRDFSALMRESHRAAALSTGVGSTVQAKQQRHVAANRPKDCGKAYAVYLQGLQSSSAARGRGKRPCAIGTNRANQAGRAIRREFATA